MARRVIALELESRVLHVAVAHPGEQGAQLELVRTLPFPADEGPAAAIQTLQEELEPGLADIAELQLPAASGYARVCHYPFRSRRKLKEVVPPDFLYRLPVDSQGLVLDHLALQEGAAESRVITAALARENLKGLVTMFAASGLPLARVSMLPWGLGAAVGRDEGEQLLAWLRDDEVGLSLVEKGEIRSYALLVKPPADTSETGDWLLRQAEVLERRHGWESLPVTLLGHAEGLQETLETAGRQVRLPRFSLPVEAGQSRVAVLALNGLRKRHSGRHNFLQGEFAPAGGWQGLRRSLRVSLALAACLLVLTATTLWSSYLVKARQVQQLETQVTQELRSLFPELRTIRDAASQFQGELRQLRINAGARETSQADPLSLLRDMSAQVPKELDLVLNEWTLATGEVRFEGSTSSFEGVDRLAETLETLAGVRQAVVAESKAGSDGRVTFRMRLLLGEGS